MSARPPKTIAGSSKRCSIATAPASPGAICRSDWATGRIPIAGSAGGPKPGSGKKSSHISPAMPTTSMRCSTAPSCGRISTALALPKKHDDQAIGRSRGGLSTKIHALVDALGNPLAFLLTAGQTHDLVGADALLPQIAADRLIADKAYDADARVREPLARAGKAAVIPPRLNRLAPRDFDRDIYKERHLIENFFCKLKQFRAIATRYDKTAQNFLAAVHLAAAIIWLN
jgi:transposase